MNEADDVVSRSWGTWEELLLAFAVNRYGTADWDSIALELKRRTSDPTLSVTAHNCRVRYLALRKRFIARNDDLEEEEGGRGAKPNSDGDSVPMLEELRKLRVAELRREVERYNINIESLELKMKRMEEERERNRSDLGKDDAGGMRDGEQEPTPAPAADGGEEMEKDQLSVNESNSTDPQADKSRTGEKESKPVPMSKEPAESKPDPDRKSVREDSCNGSSNSIDEPDRDAKAEPVSGSADVGEYEAGSDGGGAEATKENSDVQSSASKSRKEGGSDKVFCGSTSGDEIGHEDRSRAVKDFSSQSQTLIEFIRSIRAHELGSVLERRLRSQESSNYHQLILQHVDLETVESRLKEGYYSGSRNKFFRDLLLLVNNALVFFSKNSPESNSASEIRRLISKEMQMSLMTAKSDSSTGKHASLHSLSPAKKGRSEPEPESAVPLLKPRLSGPLIVCRKRSSITAKASRVPPLLPAEEEKDKRRQLSSQQEPKITKKRTRDRFSSVSANTKKNGKNQANSSSGNKNTSAELGQQQNKAGKFSSHQAENRSGNKKSQQPVLESKRRGAANFLNRMKQSFSSPTNNGALLDALKNTPLTSNTPSTKGGSGTKKNDSDKQGEKKEQNSGRSWETRPTKEEEDEGEKEKPVKRNVGRPPKKAAPPPPSPRLGKRVRERVEAESASFKQPKKKTRKL